MPGEYLVVHSIALVTGRRVQLSFICSAHIELVRTSQRPGINYPVCGLSLYNYYIWHQPLLVNDSHANLVTILLVIETHLGSL